MHEGKSSHSLPPVSSHSHSSLYLRLSVRFTNNPNIRTRTEKREIEHEGGNEWMVSRFLPRHSSSIITSSLTEEVRKNER